ncbi:MAG: Cu(I)/Ag(I) efflux system membrane protein CusA/SilA [Rhodothermales bacterium]|jgi:Cu(I)/Ag(I) efflux system membrane protein CusA/SilA
MKPSSPLAGLIGFFLHHKLVVFLGVGFIILAGIMVAPFDWEIDAIPRHPVPVDAIPDIGENQQIVFTPWMGRSPQDVEDQVSYPLTVAMLGIPGVKTVRSYSMFGFSTIYIIFEESVEFYWSRSRVLEKLNSLPAGSLPPGVQPALGPDATALGQVYWYTLEGRDEAGNPTGGWDLHELRSIQDWQVRYALLAADGIAEVASIGGFVQEYQVDVDPDAMRAHGVTLDQIIAAVKNSNLDVGARTIEINKAEYVIRGLGFIESVEDLEDAVVSVAENVPLFVKNVATVTRGPALRRGALDKGGAEAVGGVAVVRYAENPLAAIKNLKAQIANIAPGLPEKVVIDYTRTDAATVAEFAAREGLELRDLDAWLDWAREAEVRPDWLSVSKVTIVPFYDRSGLIYETLDTLNTALTEEILVTIIVILLMLMHLRSSLVIAVTLPLAVLLCFAAMKAFGVDANIVALSGIAIAIGTIVDMGVIVCENILKNLDDAKPGADRLVVVYDATREVGGAVLTAILTTIISFLPVFTMIGAEGKLFKPLAFTKTFALLASLIVALTVVPAIAHSLFTMKLPKLKLPPWLVNGVLALAVGVLLTQLWLPLGPQAGFLANAAVVLLPIAGLLAIFLGFIRIYAPLLRWFLAHKLVFLSLPATLVVCGVLVWSGLGKEFMPDLDEGSFLFMPTTMPHASIGESLDVLQKQDMGFSAIPEIESAVGKLGRAETPLDPAPVSMIETVINYHSEYEGSYRYDAKATDLMRDRAGTALLAPDGQTYTVRGSYARDESGALIPDDDGMPFRQWRLPLDPELNPNREAWPGIRNPDDIWDAIIAAGEIPGTTSAPKLQPIAARIVMLQSGMRAPMGLKVKGPDLDTIERFGMELEALLKQVPSVKADTVVADRIVGKPYLEIDIDRKAIARYGVSISKVQQVIEVGIGGMPLTTTVEGRERYPVRVRYQRERRDSIEDLENILVPGMGGQQIPMRQIANIRYLRGPQVIKSEDTFLLGYVLFDKHAGRAEVDVVEDCQAFLKARIASGELIVPAGVSYEFAGSYENQLRASKTLAVVLPVALFLIFLILYFQFKTVPTTLLVFSGIIVAWAGGFVLIGLYGQTWFMDIDLLGVNLRELFQIQPLNLSVAVWVGFLALFGIATDDGVVMTTYLQQRFADSAPSDVASVREAVVEAGCRRVRPCLITTATTILALLPVLTSTGRGADIMVPMAIPSFGGMLLALLSMFVVPVLYCSLQERRLGRKSGQAGRGQAEDAGKQPNDAEEGTQG